MVLVGKQQPQFVALAMCPQFFGATLLNQFLFIGQGFFVDLAFEINVGGISVATPRTADDHELTATEKVLFELVEFFGFLIVVR